MSQEKLDTQIRREQLAAAAVALIAEKGLKGLSVGAVARRVGLVPSALYRHFRNKDELLLAALEVFRSRIVVNLRIAREESPDALERLRTLLERHVRMIRENIAIPRVVFSESMAAGSSAAKKLALENILLYRQGIAAIISDGQAAGTIRREVDPDTGALMFLGMIMPAAILCHLTDGSFDATRHSERAWSIFRSAIAVNDDSRKRAGQ